MRTQVSLNLCFVAQTSFRTLLVNNPGQNVGSILALLSLPVF